MDSCADVSEKRPASPAIAPQPEVQNVPREHTASPAAHANTPGDTVPQLPQQDSGDDVAPPKPPRPANPLQQAEDTLKEAFPSIDSSVVRAVLRASGGNVEPAFNALLGLSLPTRPRMIQSCLHGPRDVRPGRTEGRSSTSASAATTAHSTHNHSTKSTSIRRTVRSTTC